MRIKVKGMKEMYMDGAEATACKGFLRESEIGCIGIIADVEGNYYRIDYFMVKEAYRNQGIGKKLINCMVNEICKVGGDQLIVYPNSEPYDGEKCIEVQDLYSIYESLGFEMSEENVDRKHPNNKMIMKINSDFAKK